MTSETYERLRERFRQVFDAKWDRSELDNFDELRERFAFHMADAAAQLQNLAKAIDRTPPCDTKCLKDHTEMFFIDSVPHLMAAAQIYDEIPQIFDEQAGVHDWGGFVDQETAH